MVKFSHPRHSKIVLKFSHLRLKWKCVKMIYICKAYTISIHLFRPQSGIEHFGLACRQFCNSIIFSFHPCIQMGLIRPIYWSIQAKEGRKKKKGPVYWSGLICLSGIRYMRVYCQMGMFICMELEYIGIYHQMGKSIAWNCGPICLYGIGIHKNSLIK